MQNLFSHASTFPGSDQVEHSAAKSTAIYVESAVPLSELWVAFTEYVHLWWPPKLRHGLDSYVEFGETFFLDSEDGGKQHLLAEVESFVAEDVIALRMIAGWSGGAFEGGMSFVFDEDGGHSLVDICSGLLRPRDDEDSELGVLAQDGELAQEILGGFARFMQAQLTIEEYGKV